MPGGVELDLVDAMAEPVVSMQPGWVGVRKEAPCDRLLGPRQPADPVQEVTRPVASLALQGLAERGVGGEKVVADERRRLVQDLVGGLHAAHAIATRVSSIAGRLELEEPRVPAARGDQLVVVAELDEASALDDRDLVRRTDLLNPPPRGGGQGEGGRPYR